MSNIIQPHYQITSHVKINAPILHMMCVLLDYKRMDTGVEHGYYKDGIMYWFNDDGSVSYQFGIYLDIV